NGVCDDEGEVALDWREVRSIEFGLRLGRLCLRRRDGVEHDLEGDDRSFRVKRVADAGMNLSEPADDGLRPELQRRHAPRMQEFGAARNDLHRIVRAERREE